MRLPAAKPGDLFLLFHRLPFDFSAAPHLPLSLRNDARKEPRPEILLSALHAAAVGGLEIRVSERAGEIFIEIAAAA